MRIIFCFFLIFFCHGFCGQDQCDKRAIKECGPESASTRFIDVNKDIYPESTYTIEDLVKKVLIKGLSSCGGQVSNVSVFPNTGASFRKPWGYFNRGNSVFPFKEGIVLTTGYARNVGNFYSPKFQTENLGLKGDADLSAAVGLYNPLLSDATSIEFDFVPTANHISFEYIFASEEYASGGCENSDAFALLIKKEGDSQYTNLAVVGNGIPVSVTNIHPTNESCAAQNEEYYDGANCPFQDTNFSGRTIPLKASTSVIPGESYHFKMVIADFRGSCYDSGVFLKAGSFNVGIPIKDGNGNTLSNEVNICEGNSEILTVDPINGATYQWYFNGVAVPKAKSSQYSATQTGVYKISIIPLGSICPLESEIKINMVPIPNITLRATKVLICEGEYVNIIASGADIYTFQGLPGSKNIQEVSPKITTTYFVKGKLIDGCESSTAQITIDVIPKIKSTLIDLQFCKGAKGILDGGPGPNYTYLWNTGETTQTISVEKEGTYTVLIKNGVCEKTFSAQVSYTPVPKIDKVSFFRSELIIKIEDPVPDNLEYSIDNGASWQNSNVFSNATPNIYYLVKVRVNDALCYASEAFFAFYVNNAITLNRDGINESIDFSSLANYKNFGASVFTKNGKVLWQASYSKPIWILNNLILQLKTDTLWYQVFWDDPLSGKKNQKMGWILIKNR